MTVHARARDADSAPTNQKSEARRRLSTADPELVDLLVNGMDVDTDKPTHTLLSAREFQILCRLAEGRTVTNIATILSLSVKTVSTYRARLLDKMGMKTNADIKSYAVRNSILQ